MPPKAVDLLTLINGGLRPAWEGGAKLATVNARHLLTLKNLGLNDIRDELKHEEVLVSLSLLFRHIVDGEEFKVEGMLAMLLDMMVVVYVILRGADGNATLSPEHLSAC